MKKKKKSLRLEKVIVFDLETTGFPPEAEIIEIGAVKYHKKGSKFRRISIFSERIKPVTDHWLKEAEKTHNIKRSQLNDCRTLDYVLPEFLDFIEKDAIIVGHRPGFDCTFIVLYCEKLGLPVPQNWVLDTHKIATQICEINKKIALKKRVKSYEVHLKDLEKYFNVEHTLALKHRAYIDALVTADIFFKMKNGYRVTQLKPELFTEIQFVRF